MTTSNISNTNNQLTNVNTTNQNSKASLAKNFETFLTLLTAQLQNQDPLSPLDTKDFTNQLVQFSGVEQQLKTNELLTSLTDATKLSVGATAVAYLGKEATAIWPSTNLTTGGEAKWTYELPRASSSTTIRVLDSSGRVVFTSTGETSVGEKSFTWNGKDMSGNNAPSGTYRLEVVGIGGDGKPIAGTIKQKGIISGVDLSGTTPRITINGVPLPLSTVLKIGLQSS
ncbi:flagellar hook assembly protein FlgD [Candidatus Phycosocius spiralis]|uniref:Basal-body rod modification protein FlgD n=1 Tax=Candidatus Phycosocius spiralis TaxID=2815099 RepID=A0ABQ4PTA6_9PROT|nr:flagellar hook assembly protein FlgD [Candidatus Phycosocius spiralis]GIU66222.1 flagellar hook assembly protein [Candidatus Phycosocius spiralis]